MQTFLSSILRAARLESLPGTFERNRAKLVARRPLDIFRIGSHWRLGSMEDAFDRRARCTSDTSRRICSVRIAQRKILILRKRPDCFLDYGALRLDGGEEVELISSLEAGYWGYWAVVKNGIYYLDMTTKPGIAFFDITTHRITRMFDLESRPAREDPGLAISPDERTILYTQLDASNSDIILVENFR